MGGKNGSVVLFLRNLPCNITRQDLRQFLIRELRAAGLRGTPLMSLCPNVSILRITDPATGGREYHGLVEVQPARIALQAIEILNGRELAGTLIEVRRFRHRSAWGERRLRSADGPSSEPLRERRRPNLKMDLVDATPSLQERLDAVPG